MKYIKVTFSIDGIEEKEIGIRPFADSATNEEIKEKVDEEFKQFAREQAHLYFDFPYTYTPEQYTEYLKKCSVEWHLMTEEEIEQTEKYKEKTIELNDVTEYLKKYKLKVIRDELTDYLMLVIYDNKGNNIAIFDSEELAEYLEKSNCEIYRSA